VQRLDWVRWLTRAHNLLKNGSVVKPYTGNMCVRKILRNFILSQRARKAYYLFSETATYIRSRKDNKEPI